jgi:hypothetical protein
MNYTLSRNGAMLGAFAEAELREGINGGQFRADDHVWTEGMPDWQPLGHVLGLAAAPPPLPPAGVGFYPQQTMAPRHGIGDDFGMRMLLPVGRSGWAIAAGYLGLFAFLAVPAPLAVIVSILAILDIQKSKKSGQSRKHGMGRAIFGLVAGIGGTVVLALVVISWLSRSP